MIPLVSICIPAYNAEKYIGEALDSVLQQTYPHIEIIVVNDGSTDGTAEILDSYRGKNIKVFHCPNKGAAAARNYAFQQSNGNFIKFMDGDDLISENMIEEQVKVLSGGNHTIASAEWGRFYDDDLNTFKPGSGKEWRDMAAMDWLITSLWDGPNMMQPGIFLIPRTVIDKAGLWDERLSLIDDFDFMIRVILASEGLKFTPGAKLYYRSGIAQGSLSGQKSRKAMESAWLSNDLGCRHMLSKENSNRVRKVCADSYQLWAYNFYPEFPDLVAKAEQKVEELGSSTYPILGGKFLKSMTKLVGWKNAKKLQLLSYKLGYKP